MTASTRRLCSVYLRDDRAVVEWRKMRSTNPIPDDLWPHDMSITIEERSHALLKLLWIREAYDLRPDGDDLPPSLDVSPRDDLAGVPSAAERAEWTAAWPSLWASTLAHAGKDFDRALHERLSQTSNGSPERLHLLQEIVGPSWRDRFGPGALDHNSYREWNDTVQAKFAARPAGVEGEALRRDLDAVIGAWRTGMTRIVTIPCLGEYTRRVGDNALLITEQMMASSDAFRRALSAFR
ncbi:hypothetical protein ACFT30_01655 [Microbacterium ureisolvens]|uniref:hypothetical protein n=1 Tax=Microbacterium ureisolvens TaxID=2781186 RepID=UPI0036373A68